MKPQQSFFYFAVLDTLGLILPIYSGVKKATRSRISDNAVMSFFVHEWNKKLASIDPEPLLIE
jgi:hypothetical protein